MLVTIFSSMALTNKRMMMQIFSSNVLHLWDKWVLRFMVLSSLIFQGILILLGNKRKHCTKSWLRITLWFSYLLADWLATISLGVLSNKVGGIQGTGNSVEPKYVIISLWAPILLIHLGGSDTITAYSMEDNELWSRRFLSFIVQFVVALYVFLRAWTDTDLNVLAIPIFIVGIIKMGERIWVLWSASSQQFKESLFPDPDPGPNYARYMETYIAASHEGFMVDVKGLETPSVGDDHTHAPAEANIILPQQTDSCGSEIVKIAHKFFKTFKPLFADLILSFHDVLESRLSLQNGSGKKVFQVMEVELGFMFDLFYTKATVTYSSMSCFLRFLTLSCNVSVLCAFFVVQKSQYPKVDVFLTYVLLLGAIFLEICSVISLYILSPDKTMLWLSSHKNKVTSHMMRALKKVKNKRWSRSIGQFNLISFCLKTKEQRCSSIFHSGKGKAFKNKLAKKCCLVQMITSVHQSYQKYRCSDVKILDGDLMDIIFEHFIEKIKEVNMGEEVKDEEKVADEIKRFCYHRGNKVLERFKCSKQLGWSVKGEFDQSILLWHIATDLCYNCEDVDNGTGQNYGEASKLLSEYMLYLLVMRPSMLPNGIGEIRFQDTCAEATEFVMDRKSIKLKKDACQKLLELSSESESVLPSEVKGDRSKSILFDACRLAIGIRKLSNEQEWENKTMWDLITQVWVEMLGYAASHCQGIHHAQQLRHGGELLTHVCLLMAHLGITDQFQISKGHARKKLIRK